MFAIAAGGCIGSSNTISESMSSTTSMDLCFKNLEFYRDCKEVYDLGETCSGVYTIKPDNLPSFDVSTIIRADTEFED